MLKDLVFSLMQLMINQHLEFIIWQTLLFKFKIPQHDTGIVNHMLNILKRGMLGTLKLLTHYLCGISVHV